MKQLLVLGGVGLGALAMMGGLPEMGAMAGAKRECKAMLNAEGHPKEEADAACECLGDKAEAWRDENPDAEYTSDIHMRFAGTCLGGLNWNMNAAPDWGGSRAGTAKGTGDWGGDPMGEDSDWGE